MEQVVDVVVNELDDAEKALGLLQDVAKALLDATNDQWGMRWRLVKLASDLEDWVKEAQALKEVALDFEDL